MRSEQTTFYMRIRAEKLGGHIHCSVFSGPAINQTLACNGTLVFDEREWATARERLPRFADEVNYKG